MKEKHTLMDKIMHFIGLAGNAVMMNLLFLAPGFVTLLLLLGADYLYNSGYLGNPVISGILVIIGFLPMALFGQTFCGLLSGIRYNIRGEKWHEGFKKGFKTRFWRGTIAWCLLTAVNVYMLMEVHYGCGNVRMGSNDYIPQLIFASVVLAMTLMLTTSLLVLNVYIPTPIGRWIETAVNMIFTKPLQLLGSALVLWLPVLLAVLRFDIFWNTAIVYLALYFSLAGLIITMLLKNGLLDYLVAARADGVLLAEEGKQHSDEDEEEEDEEDEDEEEEA